MVFNNTMEASSMAINAISLNWTPVIALATMFAITMFAIFLSLFLILRSFQKTVVGTVVIGIVYGVWSLSWIVSENAVAGATTGLKYLVGSVVLIVGCCLFICWVETKD